MKSIVRAAILFALWAILPGAAAEAAPTCAVTTPIGTGAEEILGLAVQSDGKIVAVGFSFNGSNDDVAVVRYNPDLTLDTSFGGTGKVVTPIGTSNDRAVGVAIQPDGKLVVVGSARMGANNDLAIARYNPNGSLDLGFDGDGTTTLDLGGTNDDLFDVAIQTDGKIVAVGRTGNVNHDFLVTRFGSNGALDFSFAGGGIRTFSIGSFDEAANAVALQPDGKIVVAGTEFDPADDDVVVARFNPNGSFDTSFAGGAGFLTNSPPAKDHANDVAIQSDGKIVIVGDSDLAGDRDVTVMRLTSAGFGDPSFNGTGFVRTDLGSAGDLGAALRIQPDGKIVVAGTGGGAGIDMWALRYDSSGALDLGFDGDGKASVGISGSTSAYGVAIGSSGSVYVGGSAVGNSLTLDFTVGRFNSDGSSPCAEIYLHPNGASATPMNFMPVSGCSAGTEWQCVNDQAGDAPLGFPVPHDNGGSSLRNSSTGRAMFRLADFSIPPGAIVNRIEIFGAVGKQGGADPSFKFSYQRVGFEGIVDGPTFVAPSSCCMVSSWIVSGIAWSAAELDALEIGLFHTVNGALDVSQLYAHVTYMLAPPVVNYRSIGTAPDYAAGMVFATFNSTDVTGTGMAWRSAKRGRGDRILIEGVDYTILDVVSDTELTLTTPFTGASGGPRPYVISRQYFSPDAWEDCIDGNPCNFFPVGSPSLVADNRREVGVVYDDGAPYNTQLVIEGTATDAIHDILLTVNPADRHFGRANVGVIFDRQTLPGPVVYILDDFVTIEWLEIRNGSSLGIDIDFLSPVNHIVLRNNIVHDVPSIGIRNSSIAVLDVYNNVVYDANNGIELGPSTGAQVFNNTLYNGGGNGITGGASPNVRNNIVHTFAGADFSFGSVHPSSSNNLSEDMTAASASPGGGARPNVPITAVDFVSTTSGMEDLHILNTSAAKDVGTQLALFSNDIDDGQRPVLWDIGADEFGATSGPSTNYFSIGINPGILASGSAMVPSGSTTVTFGVGLPTNVGIGDKLVLDPGGPNEEVFYILSRTSATEVEVQAPAVMAHPGHFFQIQRAFNSLQIWESSRQGDLVGDNRLEVGVAYNDGAFPAGVFIDGSNTDQAHFLTLTVAPGQHHTGVAGTGAAIDGGNSAIGEIVVADAYTVVEWLEIRRVRGATSAGVKVEAPGVLLGQLVVYDSSAGAVLAGPGGASFTIRNSILYGNDRDGIAGNVSTDAFTVLNCTVFGNSQQGIDAVGSMVVDVRNTVSMGNSSGDFAVGPGFQVNNMSSDGTAVGFPFMIPAGEFVSTSTGGENFHLKAGAVAAENGVDLSSVFQNDVDDDLRPLGAQWDMGADELGGGGGVPAASISSFTNQSFTVGGPMLPAASITITETTATPTITAANDLRIRIPLGFPMRFDPAQTNLFISGPAFLKVSNQVKAYEDSDRTVVLDVQMDFGPSDQIVVDFLRFWNFTAPAAANLELEVGNDGVASATDDKTITIVPDTFATLSSDDHQAFVQFQPPANALPFTVSEGTSPTIVFGNDIRIRIPVGLNMTWDGGGPISFSGPAALKVGLPVAYEDTFRTLRIPVTTNFSSGDYVTVSGARFQGFTGASLGNLQLDVGGSTDDDDKSLEIVVASDVASLTATAKNQYVKLEWLQPAGGLCDAVLIVRRDDGIEPMGPGDGDVVDNRFPCPPAGDKDFVEDPLPLLNGTLYAYAVFVEYSGGIHTSGAFVKARPMDTLATPVEWAYSTGAAAMATPGLRFSGAASYVYVVSNDGIVHSVNGGSGGGDWPGGWKPYELGGPAQSRPPVVAFPVGTAPSGAAFVGSQDGNVYAVDALDGREVWKRWISTMVQAAPSGHFRPFTQPFDPLAPNIVIVGTRETDVGNELVALDVHTGAPVWSFDNSSVQGGDDKEIGFISGSASIDYQNRWAFFASHTRGGAMGSNRTLWCVDFSTGSPALRWSLPLGDIESSPVLWDDAVYVGTTSGILYAVDRYASTGIINWSHSIGDGRIKGFPFPQLWSNRVLVSTNGMVTSFEDLGTTYNIPWQLTSSDIPGPSTPVFVPGTGKILVGSSDGHLYQMDAFTPLPTRRVQLGNGGSVVGVPAVDILKSMIYVGTDEGVIYGIRFPLPP